MAIDLDEEWRAEPGSPPDSSVVGPVFGAYHTLRHRLELEMGVHGLDATAGIVLAVLLREPMCAPNTIHRRLGLHRSTVSSILDRLEKSGWIVRPRSAFNGQRFELNLTRAGRLRADMADFVIRELEEEIASHTSRRDRRAALEVFYACAAIDQTERRSRA